MAALLDSRLARTELVISMDSDIASVVSLVGIFQIEGCDTDDPGKAMTLISKINTILERISVSVGYLQTSTIYDDVVYLEALLGDVNELKSTIKFLFQQRTLPASVKINYDRLILNCTEFKRHLDALKNLYDTCIPELMEKILESMDKIQRKLCEPP